MTIEGIDLSYARPGGTAIAAAGKQFVVRYLTGAGKALTPAEAADYHAHGLRIALVFEGTGAAADVDTAAEGVRDGKAALAAATTLGIPVAVPVYFAFDFDAQPAQQPAIDAYLRGAASVLGAARIGAYGGINLMNRIRANGTARWFWQTYAWSAGRVAPFIHLYQYRNGQKINGGWVDLCRAYRANYGQWPQPAVAPSGLKATITGYTPLYNTPGGTKVGAVRLASYIVTRSVHAGQPWYQIVSRADGSRAANAHRWFRPTRSTRISRA